MTSLSNSDHVLRYCRPRYVNGGIIHFSAFELRLDEEFLSVNWMEYFGESVSVEEQTEGIRTALSKKLELKSNGRFARFHVGTVKARIQNTEVKQVPGPKDPSHAGIYSGKDNRETALELKNIIESDDVFPALKDE